MVVIYNYRKVNKRMKKILVINGPNINFLGIREKGIYGSQNYDALVDMINKKAEELGVEVEVFQNNSQGAIIDRIQQAYFENVDGIVINPGAYTHYSYAIRDALASIEFQRLKFISLMFIQEKNSVMYLLRHLCVQVRL